MSELTTNVGAVALRSPILTAAGTSGYGDELAAAYLDRTSHAYDGAGEGREARAGVRAEQRTRHVVRDERAEAAVNHAPDELSLAVARVARGDVRRLVVELPLLPAVHEKPFVLRADVLEALDGAAVVQSLVRPAGNHERGDLNL